MGQCDKSSEGNWRTNRAQQIEPKRIPVQHNGTLFGTDSVLKQCCNIPKTKHLLTDVKH